MVVVGLIGHELAHVLTTRELIFGHGLAKLGT